MGKTLNSRQSYVNLVDNTTGVKTKDGATITINGSTRYYSSIDANIYIGNTYVDEIVGIEFNVQQLSQQLYGYNSYTYDDIAQGARMISGKFMLNMTKPNFLFDILETAKKSSDIFFVKSDGKIETQKNLNISSSSETKVYGDEYKAMWDVAFDIDIVLGSSNPVHYILAGVVLTHGSVQIGGSGENVKEMYTFIARNMTTL